MNPMLGDIFGVSAFLIMGSIPAFIAKSKGRSFFLWWMYGLVLFIFAIIHSLLLKPTEQKLLSDGMKKCPFCAEIIKPEARICKYCRSEVDC